MSDAGSSGTCAWPVLPVRWSYSTARAILTCPRQWALRRSDAAELRCAGQQRLTWPLLRGLASHAVLEVMIKIHAERGGPPARDISLARFWRDNLPKRTSELIRDAIELQISRGAEPASVTERLRARAHHEERALVQFVNAKTTFALALLGAPPAGRQAGDAIELGANAEVRLEAAFGADQPSQWRGDADLIVVRGSDVVIADYKTGAEDDSHRDQLELYALLLARDPKSNPSGLRATELALLYWSGREDRWPAPDEAALERLEQRWAGVVEQSRRARDSGPPPARVSAACARCEKRGKCDVYWRDGLALTRGKCDDRELQIQGVNRDGSELICTDTVGSQSVRLLVPQRLRSIAVAVRPGDRLRVTDIAGAEYGRDVSWSLGASATITVF
jgi:hypothetical protein